MIVDNLITDHWCWCAAVFYLFLFFSHQGFRLRLEASCPVTHSSEMTHLSSSQPTQALFDNATILVKPWFYMWRWMESFFRRRRWRSHPAEEKSLEASVDAVFISWPSPLSLNAVLLTMGEWHRSCECSSEETQARKITLKTSTCAPLSC